MSELPRVHAFTEYSCYLVYGLHDEATCRAAIEHEIGQALGGATLRLRHGAYRWVPTGGGEYDFMLHPARENESGFGQFFGTEVET